MGNTSSEARRPCSSLVLLSILYRIVDCSNANIVGVGTSGAKASVCKPGLYNARTGGPCHRCPRGKYQPAAGQHFCYIRPKRHSDAARTFGPRVSMCKPGLYNARTGGPCRRCPVGKYQPAAGQHFCYVRPKHASNDTRRVRFKTKWATIRSSTNHRSVHPAHKGSMCGNTAQGRHAARAMKLGTREFALCKRKAQRTPKEQQARTACRCLRRFEGLLASSAMWKCMGVFSTLERIGVLMKKQGCARYKGPADESTDYVNHLMHMTLHKVSPTPPPSPPPTTAPFHFRVVSTHAHALPGNAPASANVPAQASLPRLRPLQLSPIGVRNIPASTDGTAVGSIELSPEAVEPANAKPGSLSSAGAGLSPAERAEARRIANSILKRMGLNSGVTTSNNAPQSSSVPTATAHREAESKLYVSPAGVTIRATKGGVLLARPPFLLDGALNRKANTRSCMEQCALLFQCDVGTFIRLSGGEGECWLSRKRYKTKPLPCSGLKCESFVREHYAGAGGF